MSRAFDHIPHDKLSDEESLVMWRLRISNLWSFISFTGEVQLTFLFWTYDLVFLSRQERWKSLVFNNYNFPVLRNVTLVD